MSASGALIVALGTLLFLACLAGWLLNVPLPAIAVFALAGAWMMRGAWRRLARQRARQDTES